MTLPIKTRHAESPDAVVATKKPYGKPKFRIYGYVTIMTETSGMMGSLNDGIGMSNKTH
jgi:hypothetical protein